MNKRNFTARIILVLALALIGLPVYAKTLSPDEALKSAIGSAPTGMMRAPGANIVLAHTCIHDGLPTIYLFEDGNGLYIISADDTATPLLGYADKAAYDPSNLPPAFMWYIENQSRAIAAIAAEKPIPGTVTFSEDPIFKNAKRTPLENRSVIEPIITTTWDQDSPYNDQCPLLGGNRAVTGCVATAVSQVMNHHQWPAQGTGSISYTYNYNGTEYSENITFEGTSYDWSSMIDSYANGAGTEQQRSAVATLMHHVGAASQMNYGPSSSGAVAFYAAKGLLNYFDYDKGLTYEEREWYTQDDWNGMVYDELKAGRPVVYGGADTNNNGHEFVCDGYYGDDLFHINWGWSGTADGYFLLPLLNPTEQGIGGGSGLSGFTKYQHIFKGMQKNVNSNPLARLAFQDELTVDKSSYARNSENVVFQNAFYSYMPLEASLSVGFKFIYNDGSSTILAIGNVDNLKPLYGFTIALPGSAFPVGDYTVVPVCRLQSESDSDWVEMKHNVVYTLPRFVVTEDEIQVNPAPAEIEITCKRTSIVPNDANDGEHLYPGHSYDISWNISASGAISNLNLCCCIFNSDYQLVAISDMTRESFTTESLAKDLTWNMTIPTNATPGNYYMCVLKNENDTLYILNDVIDVTVEEGMAYTRTATLQGIYSSDGKIVETLETGNTYTLSWLLNYNGFGNKELFCFLINNSGAIQTYSTIPTLQGPLADVVRKCTITVPEDLEDGEYMLCLAEPTTSWEIWDQSLNSVEVKAKAKNIFYFIIDQITNEDGSIIENNTLWQDNAYNVAWHCHGDAATYSMTLRLENINTDWKYEIQESFEKDASDYYGNSILTIDNEVEPGNYKLCIYNDEGQVISINYYELTIDQKTGIATMSENHDATYYNINGYKSNGSDVQGVKIRIDGQKAVKILR